MRSCFPEFLASRKHAKSSSAFIVQQEMEEDQNVDVPYTGETDGPDSVQFEEVEAFLAEYGFHGKPKRWRELR